MASGAAGIDIEAEFHLTGRSLMELADRALKLSTPKVKKHHDRPKPSVCAAGGVVGVVRRVLSQGKRSPKPERDAGRAHLQRVAVRVSYTQNSKPGQWKAHGRYLSRGKALGEGRPFGSADDPNLEQKMAEWQAAGDPRVFKLILSPEFGNRLDLERLTRETMAQLSDRLQREFEWMAASHFDTAHPHTHVLMRGVDLQGQEIRLPKSVVKKELRGFAQHAATRQLGYRTRADMEKSDLVRATQWRWNRLDDALVSGGRVSSEYRQARLAFLAGAGLVVDGNAKAAVQAVAEASDRQRMIRASRAYLSDPRMPVVVGGLLPEQSRVIAIGQGLTLLESRAAIHVHFGELPSESLGCVIDARGELLRSSDVIHSLPRTHRKTWDAALQTQGGQDRGR